MRSHRLVWLLLSILFAVPASAGETIGWASYGHSKYVSSPGLEACYLFHPRIGLNAGLAVYLQYPDRSRLTSMTFTTDFGFYNANLGVAGYLFRYGEHGLGLTAGLKLWYGPDYRKLRYYEQGGYYIYFDASSLQAEYGPDIGIFYTWGRFAFLGKFDFARNRFRLGIGYRFNPGSQGRDSFFYF